MYKDLEKLKVTKKKWYLNNRNRILEKNDLSYDPKQRMFTSAKMRSKKKNILFTICKDDIVIPEFCPYTGTKIEARGSSRDNAPSLDRIDNSLGYIPGNIQVISWLANKMKNTATIEELVAFAKGILKFHGT